MIDGEVSRSQSAILTGEQVPSEDRSSRKPQLRERSLYMVPEFHDRRGWIRSMYGPQSPVPGMQHFGFSQEDEH